MPGEMPEHRGRRTEGRIRAYRLVGRLATGRLAEGRPALAPKTDSGGRKLVAPVATMPADAGELRHVRIP